MADDDTRKPDGDAPKPKDAPKVTPETIKESTPEAIIEAAIKAAPEIAPPAPKKTTRLGLVAGLIAVISMAGLIYVMQQRHKSSGPASTVMQSKQSGVALIGGPFKLTDHTGKNVTEQDFRGKFMLVMFGYTYCPDVCPTTLSTMSDAMDLLGDEADRVTPVFITIDPERDSVEHLKEYVTYFHPRLVALTGSAKQIKAVAKVYRVYYAKAAENKEDAEDYQMDHSSISYLMGPDGKFIAHFSHGTEAGAITQRIIENL